MTILRHHDTVFGGRSVDHLENEISRHVPATSLCPRTETTPDVEAGGGQADLAARSIKCELRITETQRSQHGKCGPEPKRVQTRNSHSDTLRSISLRCAGALRDRFLHVLSANAWHLLGDRRLRRLDLDDHQPTSHGIFEV